MIYIYLFGCIAFVILQGFFAASEISFISSPLLTLRHRQAKGEIRAGRVYRLMLKPERFLATTLVGTNVSLVLSSSLLTSVFVKLGVNNSNLWATIVFTPIVVIFAELIPKNIGRYFRDDYSCAVVDIISFFEKMFAAVVLGIESVTRFILRGTTGKLKRRSLFVTKEEIKSLVTEVAKEGGIDEGEKEAIEEVFEFRKDKVKDVCVLTKRIVGFDYTDSYERILEIIRGSGFTRYPVFHNKEIAGFINVFDIFYYPKKDWHSFIRPITKVGLNQNLSQVFTLLKSKKENIALVLKGNKLYGIITIEDLIGEIITSIIKI
jgi:CBS domain containing-hemolysin-like protein